jgi:triacylglycerol lipase
MTSSLTAKLSLALGCLAALTANANAQRDVVFVHGFVGFGKDELGPINYWGITGDILGDKSIFPDNEYTTHEASVGPVSSNWDRACELYAQIVGGQVDYGRAHSEKHGHEQFGQTYTKGFVEDWSADKQIALVGHSMGATTIRLLEILLNEGAQEEIEASGADVSPLFKGGSRGWISSVTGISAPYDGTTLVPALGNNIINLIKSLVGAIAGITGDTFIDTIYDFDLDHFGLTKQDGESHRQYKQRVFNSALFQPGFEDYSGYDLSIEGAARLNARGPQAYPETTYFSVVTSRTYRGLWPFNKLWFPQPRMFIAFQPFAVILGGFRGDDRDYTNWRQNDGIIPARSQTCPKEGVKNPASNCLNVLPTSGKPQPGKYYQISVNLDHGQVIGLDPSAKGVYRDIARQIMSLDVGSRSSDVSQIDPEFIGEIEPNWGVPEAGATLPIALVVGCSVAAVLALAVGGFVANRVRKSRNISSAVAAPVPEADSAIAPRALTCERSASYIDL